MIALDPATSRPRPRSRPSSAQREIHTLDDLEAPARPGGRLPCSPSCVLEQVLPGRRRSRRAVALPATRSRSPRAGWPSASTCKDNTFPQLLLLAEFAHDAADRIYHAIVAARAGAQRLVADPARLRHGRLHALRGLRHDEAGHDRPIPTSATSPTSSPTPSWEQKMADSARGHARGAAPTSRTRASASPSPTRSTASERHYIPDFIVRVDDGHGADDLLNLIVEVTGAARRDKAAKVATARDAVGARRQQPRRLRPLGVRRDHRPVGRREH